MSASQWTSAALAPCHGRSRDGLDRGHMAPGGGRVRPHRQRGTWSIPSQGINGPRDVAFAGGRVAASSAASREPGAQVWTPGADRHPRPGGPPHPRLLGCVRLGDRAGSGVHRQGSDHRPGCRHGGITQLPRFSQIRAGTVRNPTLCPAQHLGDGVFRAVLASWRTSAGLTSRRRWQSGQANREYILGIKARLGRVRPAAAMWTP